MIIFQNGRFLDANDLNANFAEAASAFIGGVGSDIATSAYFGLNGAAGSPRKIQFKQAGIVRAAAGLSTSNNIVIERYDASGIIQDTPINIPASSGNVEVVNALVVGPSSSSAGSDISMQSTNTGAWRFNSGSTTTVLNFRNSAGASIFRATGIASAVNYVNLIPAITAGRPAISAEGSDTNVDLRLVAKGTGFVYSTVPFSTVNLGIAPTSSITWSGTTQSSVALNSLNVSGVTHTGTSTATSEIHLNSFAVAGTDNVVMASATTRKVVGFRFAHNIATGAVGTRNGLHYVLTTTGAINSEFMTAANFFSTASHNLGGTTGGPVNALGSVFGLNSYAVISSGGTFTREACAFEGNVSVRNSGGTFLKFGIKAIPDGSDAYEGRNGDAGFIVASQSGALGFRNAYTVGYWGGEWPINQSASWTTSLFRAYTPYDELATPGVNQGIDLSEASISGSVFAYKNFRIHGDTNGSGAVQSGTAILYSSGASVSLDTPGRIGTGTPTVSAGGSDYALYDILYDSYGGVYRVASLSGTAVATVSVIVQPVIPGAAPANPVATTVSQARSDTAGTGCTLTLSWTAGTTINIGTTTATNVNVGRSGQTTVIDGTTTLSGVTSASTTFNALGTLYNGPASSAAGSDFSMSSGNTGAWRINTGSTTTVINFRNSAGASAFRIANVASAVNYLQVTPAVTTGNPVMAADGSDANISLRLAAKGTGSILLQSATSVTGDTTTSGVFKVGANQVLGARITGWGAATNGSRVAFDASTATLAQTAAAVAAIIADMTTHGAIGA